MDMCAVARYGLAGDMHPRQAKVEAAVWPRLLQEAIGQRLTGLLTAAVVDGSLELTDDQEASLVEAHRACLARDLLVERTVLWSAGRLDAAGVEHRVLKGTAVAHLDYTDAALRSFVDADILVRSEQWDRAVEALEHAGAERQSREPRPGWDRAFAKCVTLTTPDRYEVDLHRTFVFGPLGFAVHLPDLWATSESFVLGGHRLRALDREIRWLHACFTAGVADVPPRFASLRDVLQMAADPRLNLGRAGALASQWGVAGVVRRALDLAAVTLDVALPGYVSAWASTLTVGRRETATIRAYTDPGDRYVRLTVGAVRVIPGWRARAQYAAGLLWPEAGYVGYRYGGHLQRWHSVATRARRAAATSNAWQRLQRVKGSRG